MKGKVWGLSTSLTLPDKPISIYNGGEGGGGGVTKSATKFIYVIDIFCEGQLSQWEVGIAMFSAEANLRTRV